LKHFVERKDEGGVKTESLLRKKKNWYNLLGFFLWKKRGYIVATNPNQNLAKGQKREKKVNTLVGVNTEESRNDKDWWSKTQIDKQEKGFGRKKQGRKKKRWNYISPSQAD